MPNRLEDRIRKYLAEQIHLLEDGLTFLEEEFRLPSPHGASGKIDILAKDAFGHWVLVEIKRSDQAARQALHEVHKYTALFRAIQGLDQTRVRVMVVSTEWHELLVPFSEYAETTPYSVTGISIAASPDGTITHVGRVTLAPRGLPMQFSRVQSIYLFANKSIRDEKIPMLVEMLERNWITDFVLFACDYQGVRPSVIYPHGIYLAFASPLDILRSNELNRAKDCMEWEDGLDSPEENFVVAVNEEFSGNFDSYEIGYPEKLVTISSEWNVKVVSRHGRLKQGASVLSDDEILKMAKATEGGSDTYFYKVSSPKFTAAWRQLLADVELVLPGATLWSQIVPMFFSEIESGKKEASVSVGIYNPCNFPMTLFYLGCNDSSRCPHLEISVDDPSTGTVRILMSALAWNGNAMETTPENFFSQVYGSFADWTMLMAFRGTYEMEAKAMTAHGFSTPCVELGFSRNKPPELWELSVSQGSLGRSPFDSRYKDYTDFVIENRSYIDSLCRYLRKRVAGI